MAVSVFGVALVSGALALAWAAPDVEGPLPQDVGDLSQAAAIEVADAGGQVVLTGRFGVEEAGNGAERERKAPLTAAAGSAKGEAEIEVSTASDGRAEQELEVDVEGLAASATFAVNVDGRRVATLTTDARGRAEVELRGPAPGQSAR
jgi:hypothetical protein